MALEHQNIMFASYLEIIALYFKDHNSKPKLSYLRTTSKITLHGLEKLQSTPLIFTYVSYLVLRKGLKEEIWRDLSKEIATGWKREKDGKEEIFERKIWSWILVFGKNDLIKSLNGF